MKLYNTLTNKKEEFVPIEDGNVSMYVCGLTVYNYMHIGNARPYIVFDTVRRYFEYKGYTVNYVQNFTDIDDKIIQKANEEGVLASDIAKRYIDEAYKDCEGLNVLKATHNPKVTEEIDGIIDMIKTLIEKGYGYEVDGTVFYSTKKFEGYGKLSGKNIDDLEAGARISVNEQKENPMDFVLWKPKKEGEPGWNSPWGEGRPGWHIECSVMAKKYLGDTIDIHAGGEDLTFPHHENEIAQSEAANDKPFSNYWLHNRFLNINNKKMSKSLGNFFTVREISDEFPYEAIRFFMLQAHYRSPINFNKDLLESAKASLQRIKNCLSDLEFSIKESNIDSIKEDEKDKKKTIDGFRDKFICSMDDDFNTADAIASIFELVRFFNINREDGSKELYKYIKDTIIELSNVLGLLEEKEESLDEKIEAMIEERQLARKNKDFKRADDIRDELASMGVELKDTREGVRWTIK